MKEIWKDVVGYEGLYQVSNFGNIKSVDRFIIKRNRIKYTIKGKNRVQKFNRKGYFIVTLCKNNTQKTHLVHRLVAKTFIPNPNNYPCVNHKDENKQNNKIENLEWCTYKYNSNYGTAKFRTIKTRRKQNNQDEINKKMKETRKKTGALTAERPVNQFTWNGEFVKRFDSSEQVKKLLGIKNVGGCASGKNLHSGGFIWLYDEDIDKIKERTLKNKPTKLVLQYDKKGNVIKKWNSPLEIHKSLGIKLTSLSNCLHGRSKSSGGYIWKYDN